MNLKELLLERETLGKKRTDVLATVQTALDAIDKDLMRILDQIEALTAPIVKLRRDAEDKPYGVVNVEYQGVRIKHDQPKRVKWDETMLAEIVEKIKASSADPSEYVKISYKVEERKYSAWPTQIKEIFAPARTTELGTAKVSFEILDSDEITAEAPGLSVIQGGRG